MKESPSQDNQLEERNPIIIKLKIKAKAEFRYKSLEGRSNSKKKQQLQLKRNKSPKSDTINPWKNKDFYGAFTEFFYEEHRRKRPEIVVKDSRPMRPPVPRLNLWRNYHDRKHGDEPIFIFERKLTATDATPSQNRLFCNKEEMVNVLIPTLTYDEREKVEREDKTLHIRGIDQHGRRYKLKLTFWKGVNQYPLIGEWNLLRSFNGLVKGSYICVWFFRYGDLKRESRKLAFLISSSQHSIRKGDVAWKNRFPSL